METRTDMPRILFNGNKILKMQAGKITWLDSLSYLQCALRQVPKLCGLDIDLRKGFFPHDFNTPENRDYVGPLPPKDSFGIKFHRKDEIEEFDKWYEDEKKRFARERCVYDLKDEMRRYCEQDVKVLRAGFLTFDKNVEQLTGGFRCGEDNCTMAGLANLHLRSTWPDSRIGQVPVNGYGHHDVQSREGLAYMFYLDAHKYHGRLEHAKKNAGEARITAGHRSFKADGFDPQTNTIEEFAGCMWHGCINKCYTPQTKNPITGRSLLDCRQEFQTRNALLREAGYTVNVTWECDFRKRLEQDAAFAQSIRAIRAQHSQFLREPFELRKALFGGRTEAFKLLQEADPDKGESIEFVDVTSLYPSRMVQCEYPWGHPTVITDATPDQVRKYRGLFHVKVLPVKDAYIPWLPSRIETRNGTPKLVYTNCRKCAETFDFRIQSCQHTDDERALTGIWTSDELFAALDAGYKVLECYEIWHYMIWTTVTYEKYVKTWMKVKQEASGYPAWADTEEKKRQYIENYERDEGIKLDPDKIVKNEVLRKIAKLFLNSSWGFWGRDREKKKKQVVRDPEMFFKLMCDSSLKNKRASWLSGECLLFEASVDRAGLAPDTKGSLVHAIFTTALARVLLTRAMVALGRRTIYGDTDSIAFFKDRPGFQPGDVTLSDGLGGWTKVEEEGIIVKMVAGRAKNYGYQVLMPDGTIKTKFKVRGITLNSATEELVNFDTLQSLVWESKLNDIMGDHGDNDANGIAKREIRVPRLHFNRIFKGARGDEESSFTIRPEETTKTYKLVFDKRVLDKETFFTFPFGYCK